MESKWSRRSGRWIGGVVALLIAGTAGIAGVVLWTNLTEYGAAGKAAGAAVTGVGVALAFVAYRRVARFCSTPRRTAGAAGMTCALLLFGMVAMVFPGKITASRFGLTVYGLVPVPMLDLRIGASGWLGFRDKTHFVSAEEARGILTPDTEALVIGTGWDGVVRVDPAVRALEGVEIHILRTPEAFALYNRLKSSGAKVALLAHSTC